jgi:glycosyltransferase involved in cell wall biosynthesis
MGISIVIPAYNEEQFLPATLKAANEARAAFTSATGLNSEIIVVDNVSTDQTAMVARALGACVILHDVRNISSVRNAGIRAAVFPIVVAIDADCFLPADGLVQIWEYMSDERVVGAALGLRVLSDKKMNRAIASLIQGLVVRTSGILGAVFCFRRDVALEIGGFPEDKLIAEDSAFAMTMRNFAAKSGRTFGLLRSVEITTLDRKELALWQLPGLMVQAVRAFRGAHLRREDLKFWYDPDR